MAVEDRDRQAAKECLKAVGFYDSFKDLEDIDPRITETFDLPACEEVAAKHFAAHRQAGEPVGDERLREAIKGLVMYAGYSPVRQLAEDVSTVLAALRGAGRGGNDDDDGPCYYCGKMTGSLAANPNLWPLRFPHDDDPGVVKYHHVGCVTDRLAAQPEGD